MRMRITGTARVAFLTSAGACLAQQKGQYIPGTNGLNAGIQPPPGFSYSNVATFYDADRLKGTDAQPTPVSGSFDLRIDQDYFIFTSSNNGGPQLPTLQDARYRVVAIGPQASLIVPKWNAIFFFRYDDGSWCVFPPVPRGPMLHVYPQTG